MTNDVTRMMKTFELESNQGPDRVLPLDKAVRRYVESDMTIHMGEHANAAIREVLRQFRGLDPRFTVVTPQAQDYVTDLIHAGLVGKLIFSMGSEVYPRRGPSKVVQRACREGKLEIENWSLHSLTQRLMAGAMGLPCMPTRSIMGSSMADDNRDSFIQLADPFGSGRPVGLVRALQPDVSFIHAWAADSAGNILMDPASFASQGVWGALASRTGVIATVEKIVSTDYIRDHSHLVKIPGYMVNSVSEVRLGRHPQGMCNHGVREFPAYGPDHEFLEGHREASRSPEALDVWIKEWVLECPTNDDYIKRLGPARVSSIYHHGVADSWRNELPNLLSIASKEVVHNAIEMMVVAAAREIAARTMEQDYKVILAGAGASALAAWLAYYNLREMGHDVELAMGTGVLGYEPRPGSSQFPDGINNISTAKMITDITHIYGVIVGGANNRCLSVLGAGQIDKNGNINITRMSSEVFLIGSGGANDATNAAEILVVTRQSINRFLDRVPYVTCSGEKVITIVSDKGVYCKSDPQGEMHLVALFPDSRHRSLKTRIGEVRESCGWHLQVHNDVRELPAPTQEELTLLRSLDPYLNDGG